MIFFPFALSKKIARTLRAFLTKTMPSVGDHARIFFSQYNTSLPAHHSYALNSPTYNYYTT
jgi:hypothetical protein